MRTAMLTISVLLGLLTVLSLPGNTQQPSPAGKPGGAQQPSPGGTPGGAAQSIAKVPDGTIVNRDIAYVSTGQPSQRLDLYMNQNSLNPPLIIMIHGGAFMAGDKSGEDVTKFLKAGYAVASVNYRLSGDAPFPAQIQDCKAAVRWLRANAVLYSFDADRFGAYGESAGGNLVALLGTTGDIKTFDTGENLKASSKVQAVVDFFGPTDFLQMDAHSFGGNSPAGQPHNDANSPESKLIGGPIQDNKEKTEQANPITYITKDAPPFFIAHGDADKTVPHHQSELLEAALKQAGVPVTLYTLPGVGHAFHNETADKMALDFFAKYLSPAKGK